MKRLFVIVYAVLFALSALALAMQPHPDSRDKSVHLTWVTDDSPARQEQIRLFQQSNPGIEIAVDQGNGGMDKIIVQSEAGVGPDLFDSYSPADANAYARSGIAWNVTQPLAAMGVNVPAETWPVSAASALYDNQVYGFPTNAVVDGTWLNKDIFAKDGVPLPKNESWTWDQFIAVAQRLTLRDTNTGRVTQWGALIDEYWPPYVEQRGGSVFPPDGARCTIDSPQAIRGIQFLHDLIYKYRITPSPAESNEMVSAGGWGTGSMAQFAAGRSAMAIGGRYWIINLRKDQNLHLAAVECPYPAGGLKVFGGGAHSTMINANSPNRDAALKFVKYLSSEAYCRLINRVGDGISPVRKYTNDSPDNIMPGTTDDPTEENIAVWRDAMPYADHMEISPFLSSDDAYDIIQRQVDLILADEKPTAAALRDAAAQVDAEIALNISRDPGLRKQYQQAIAAESASARS